MFVKMVLVALLGAALVAGCDVPCCSAGAPAIDGAVVLKLGAEQSAR